MPSDAPYNAAVIVTSDSCSKDPDEDTSGPYVVRRLDETNLFDKVSKHIVRDERQDIVACLKETLDRDQKLALIVTVGGTGLCPRDVTPEATSSLYDKTCSGIVAGLHMNSLRYTPNAALSRLTSGIIGGTLVVNLPGSQRACKDGLDWLESILNHALEQVREDFEAYQATHKIFHALNSCKSDGPESLGGAAKVVDGSSGAPDGAVEKLLASSGLDLMAEGAPIFALPPTAQRSRKTTTGKYYFKRGPSSVISTASIATSKMTIDSMIESRSEFPPESMSRPVSVASTRSVDARMASNKALSKRPLPAVTIKPIQGDFELIDFMKALDILTTESKALLGSPISVDISSHTKAMSGLGVVLARDIVSKRTVPNHAVSTMDGYVLHIPPALKPAIDKGQVKLAPARLVTDLEQFHLQQKNKLLAGTFFCYQVNTGGRLPYCNYAVIPFERTKLLDNNQVQILEIKQGAYVRRAGTDVGKDDVVRAGSVMGPVELAVIMAMGHRGVTAHQRPKIGVLSTGDELEDFHSNQNISEDDVVDTNGPLLTAMFRSKGLFSTSLGVARDDPNDIYEKLRSGLEKNDIIVISGGASMGTKDHVKSVIVHLGGKIHFGRVNMKPGKPVAFATLKWEDKPKFIFALPGNPVSAYITATLLVIPFIQNGMRGQYRPGTGISFDGIGDVVNAEVKQLNDGINYYFEGRLEFVRAKIIARRSGEDSGRPLFDVEVSVKQQSSRMLNLIDCDCLLMINPDLKGKLLGVGQRYPALKLHKQY